MIGLTIVKLAKYPRKSNAQSRRPQRCALLLFVNRISESQHSALLHERLHELLKTEETVAARDARLLVEGSAGLRRSTLESDIDTSCVLIIILESSVLTTFLVYYLSAQRNRPCCALFRSILCMVNYYFVSLPYEARGI